MTTPKLKFSHAELTEAGFVRDMNFPSHYFYDRHDGRSIDAETGRLFGAGRFIDSLDELYRPSWDDAARLATANATIARLTEERDALIKKCEDAVGNIPCKLGHDGECVSHGHLVCCDIIYEIQNAIALVKGGGK